MLTVDPAREHAASFLGEGKLLNPTVVQPHLEEEEEEAGGGSGGEGWRW